MFYVYAHINPKNNNIFYIGKGKGDRINDSKGRNLHWNNIVNKYGFFATKLVDGLTNEQACEIEKQYIQKYGFFNKGGLLVNLTTGGNGGNTETELNKEAKRKKCSESKLGSKNPNYGKSFKNRKLSEETKKKISKARKGYKTPEDVKIKVLAGLKKAQEKNRKKIICLVTGKIWNNRLECAADLNISVATVKQRIKRNKIINNSHLKTIK